MWIVLAILGALVAAALIYLASLDGNYRAKRSLLIDAPLGDSFAAVVDFKSWPHWSPWLMHEPDAELVYSDDYQAEDGYYTWDGQVVGAGRLTHVSIKTGSRISQEIEFFRPFKSVNQVNWEFETRGDQTLISWEMVGSMPFLFRFMARKMEPMIGRDYELGLALLNGYLNANAPHPGIAFIGSETLDDFSYWSIPFVGKLRQLEAARKTSIESLQAAAGPTGLALTLYQHIDPMDSTYHAEIAIPVSERTPESNYARRDFRGGRYFKMTLRGDHSFLPLGWYALFSHCRMHKIKLDKSRPALEIYHDDPVQIDDSNRITTTLYLAIR